MQSNEILLNLSIKCWNSEFNAQGLRVIVVVVHVGGATKVYMCNVSGGAQEKKERQIETQFTTKIDGKTSLGSSLLFCFVKFSFDRLKLSLPPKLIRKLVWVPVRYFAL
jgi:hypothetical protein